MSFSLIAKNLEVSGTGGDCENKIVKKSLFKNLNGVVSYSILNARKNFIQLGEIFTKALILEHFYQGCHIWIKTNILGYAIDKLLSQLILDNLRQWHLVAYFS